MRISGECGSSQSPTTPPVSTTYRTRLIAYTYIVLAHRHSWPINPAAWAATELRGGPVGPKPSGARPGRRLQSVRAATQPGRSRRGTFPQDQALPRFRSHLRRRQDPFAARDRRGTQRRRETTADAILRPSALRGRALFSGSTQRRSVCSVLCSE